MDGLKEDIYITPQIEIVKLSNLDVITTSNPIEDSMGDTWQS